MFNPVRPAFRAIESVVDRVVCVLGAVIFSQWPEFMQQYLQRLGGHLDEARRELTRFQAAAGQAGLSLDQWVQATAGSGDPAVSRLGQVVRETSARVATLSTDEAAIRHASAVARPFVFLRHADPSIVRATWEIFRPAVPTTVEGAVYALAGVVFLLAFYHGAVRYPTRKAWRRWRERRSALRSRRGDPSISGWTTR
jgi:hypothetical protein